MYEETLVLLKPDALERRLVGRIIQRYEDAGLEILDIRYYRRVDEELIRRHYPDSMAAAIGRKAQAAVGGIADPEAYGLRVLEWLHRYVTRGSVIAMRIGGEDAISTVRRVTGFTDPSTAERGTIRGDYGVDSLKRSTEEGRACENLVHASGNREEAEAELALWFPERR
ncbi:MAG: nucleoside-diphosphate kinase [Candidatus Bathyarchaeia archaeon]